MKNVELVKPFDGKVKEQEIVEALCENLTSCGENSCFLINSSLDEEEDVLF